MVELRAGFRAHTIISGYRTYGQVNFITCMRETTGKTIIAYHSRRENDSDRGPDEALRLNRQCVVVRSTKRRSNSNRDLQHHRHSHVHACRYE